MRLFERYLFWRIATAFTLTLTILTAVVWVTQALRRLDLVTVKGQTLLFFVELTILTLPNLVTVVAPFALLIAIISTLNAMITDSELVVVGASGGSRWIVLKPLMIFAVSMSLLIVVLSAEIGPAARRVMAGMISKVRVDVIAHVLRPGRFTDLGKNLTFHIASRTGDGILQGIVLSDRRKKNEELTYLAEHGQIVEVDKRSLLIMKNGVIQRRSLDSTALSNVVFESYGFDLSHLVPSNSGVEPGPAEHSLSDLMFGPPVPKEKRRLAGRLRSELHSRLVEPLFPIVFALIAFMALGHPRTFRQGRELAITTTIVACLTVRVSSFGGLNLTQSNPAAAPIVYAMPVAVIVFASWMILADRRLMFPNWLSKLFSAIAGHLPGAGRAPGGSHQGGTS